VNAVKTYMQLDHSRFFNNLKIFSLVNIFIYSLSVFEFTLSSSLFPQVFCREGFIHWFATSFELLSLILYDKYFYKQDCNCGVYKRWQSLWPLKGNRVIRHIQLFNIMTLSARFLYSFPFLHVSAHSLLMVLQLFFNYWIDLCFYKHQ
jgi:hypothetical protein